MFLNDGPPIYGGRELWGFPKKYAQPTLCVDRDTLLGTLDYGRVRIATGTMGFKHMALDAKQVRAGMPGTPTIGTKEMASRVAQRAREIVEMRDKSAGESIGNEAAARPS